MEPTSEVPVRRRRHRRRRSLVRSLRWQAPIAVVVGLAAAFTPLATSAGAAHAASVQHEGLVCAPGSTADFYHAPAAPLPRNPSFVLTAQDGYILTPDGNSIYMWGYGQGNGDYQDPGPTLCVNEGDSVTITLKNTLAVPTSLAFPGLAGVKANGANNGPDTNPAHADSLAIAADPQKAVTYTFTADHPGTFYYESGTNPQLQAQMGLVGAIVVRPLVGNACLDPALLAAQPHPSVCTPSNHVYDDPSAAPWLATTSYVAGNVVTSGGTVWQATAAIVGALTNVAPSATNTLWKPGSDLSAFSRFSIDPTTKEPKEYLHLLSEVDPKLHEEVEQATHDGKTPEYDMGAYQARYFFINGRSFPDTVSPNFAAHVPSQPYGSLVHVQPRNTAPFLTSSGAPSLTSTTGGRVNPDYNPDPALVRYVNVGPVNYPFHPHSNNERQVGFDGQALINPTGANGDPADLSYDRFGITVPPGQTLETEFAWTDQQEFATRIDPATGKPGIGVPVPDQASRTEGAYWSGSPYLGQQADHAPAQEQPQQFNQCGEMYQVAHSHALFQATNYGASMGGMLTMIRVDPPNSFPSHAKCIAED